MANKINKVEITTPYKHIQIREITDDGGFHRRVLTSNMDISGESEHIQEKAAGLWTDEVKESWLSFKEELKNEKF